LFASVASVIGRMKRVKYAVDATAAVDAVRKGLHTRSTRYFRGQRSI